MLREKRIKTTTAVYSDVGKVRKANEDSYYISKDENLIIVCDGMGGQVAGGLASKIAVETIKDVYQDLSDEHVQNFLYDPEANLTAASRRLIAAVRLANRRIYKISAKFPRLRGMGTTVVALSLDKSFATMVHVGDSRIFRISNEAILQLTEDHSWLNELIEDNEINEEQVETFAQKNVITRALGTAPTVKIDIHCEKYKRDDIYILCTDGLHNSMSGDDIKKIFDKNNGSIDAITRKLIEKAVQRDGTDNVTVAVAKINQDSKDTKLTGISTTIPEEGEKIIERVDKFIQENYGEPQLKMSKKPTVNTMNHRKFVIPGLVLLTGLLCFILGMVLQATNPDTIVRNRANIAGTNTAKNSTAMIRNTEQVMPATGANLTQANSLETIPVSINRSELSSDAVLAFVFFNSTKDFNDARLDERGKVLEKIYPYANDGNTTLQGDFSIFLIDSSNNVTRKISGLQIPANPN